ncbi:MAG: hypothetical protein FJ225_02950 [Lentisphaerae bacterium]|nr:hypothetical protein [Lentisphaerota bacterium]
MSASRFGRRTLTTAVIVLALLLVAEFAPAVSVWVLIAALACLAQLEFYRMAGRAGIPTFRLVGTGCGAALITVTFGRIGPRSVDVADTYGWEQLALLASLILVFIRQFPQKYNDKPIITMACTLLGIWYVPLLFNFVTRLAFVWERGGLWDRVGDTGRLLVLYLIVVVKSGDVGAYLVGSRIGRHKLLPRISPNKTWEGLAGGVGAGVCASLLFGWAHGWRLGVLGLAPDGAVVLGVLLTGAGVLGDMFESLIKRACGVKDSGGALPGIGGLLDLLDSLLFAAPALYVYARMVLAT